MAGTLRYRFTEAVKKFDSSKDYYEVLGIDRDATPDEIDRVFRLLAREHHPDRGGNEEQMKSLNEAHEILTDAETREAYDAETSPESTYQPPEPMFDPEAAADGGTLSIQVSNAELAGLMTAAAACIGLGLPFLALIEMQWVMFLWPLRLLTIGALGLGVYLAHCALRLWVRGRDGAGEGVTQPRWVYEMLFWTSAAGGGLLVYSMFYGG
ncbi:MAG TPA: DnaJ domain-containing protein [Blastocatellia bacterium]|nr:DnaJ domain-containing protein [Blastocatellia bacterium]